MFATIEPKLPTQYQILNRSRELFQMRFAGSFFGNVKCISSCDLLPKSLWRGEIPIFGVKLVILESENCKLGTIFVAIGGFFED